MATTFLQAVNKVLRRVGYTSSDLSSFTDSARQIEIDVVIQEWNEVLDDMQDLGANPSEVAEGTLTLVTATREYSVPSDFVSVATDPHGRPWMIDTTNGGILWEYPGGYEKMRRDQLIPGNFSGTPVYWAINPTTGKFRLNTAPTSADNGKIYKFLYHARIDLSVAADTFPFTDDLVDNLVEAVVMLYRRDRKGGEGYTERAYLRSLSRAARRVRQVPPRTSYGPAFPMADA